MPYPARVISWLFLIQTHFFPLFFILAFFSTSVMVISGILYLRAVLTPDRFPIYKAKRPQARSFSGTFPDTSIRSFSPHQIHKKAGFLVCNPTAHVRLRTMPGLLAGNLNRALASSTRSMPTGTTPPLPIPRPILFGTARGAGWGVGVGGARRT